MKKIIACVDGTPASTAVTAHAAWAALALGAPLEFLHALDRHPETAEGGDYSGNLVADSHEQLLQQLSERDTTRSRIARERGRELLEAVKAEARALGVAEPDGRLRHGSLIENLTEMADDIEMVVTGQRHHTDVKGKLHLDHTLEGVIRGLKCPVLATLENFHQPESFMIAFDGSASGRRHVERIARHPLVKGLRCHVVIACEENDPLADNLLKWARETLEAAEIPTETAALEGEPTDTLPRYARDKGVDLMVTGAFGHSALRQLIFGSTTTTLLRTSPVPVLVLR